MSKNAENRPLWAPWRIDFIRSPKDPGCFLCNHKEPHDNAEEPLIVARYKYCFVLLNRYPYNSGHLMVAPYRHIGDIAGLAPEESHEIMDAAIDARKVLGKVMCPEGFNCGFNLGTAGGAGVADHLHLHIVPRWNGDTNFMPVLGNPRVVPEALEATAKLIRQGYSLD